MRYPLLFLVLLLVAAGVVGYGIWSAQRTVPSVWVANATWVRQLPAFVKRQRRTRLLVGATVALLSVALLSAAVVSGAPVDRKYESEASRDLVLCLDASGSMLPYDGQILDQMRQLVDQFEGERVSLQLWSALSVSKFSLTDDYDLVDDVLAEAAGVIRRGYIREEGDYVLVTAELFEYLEGVDAPDGQEVASLVGDGLASCVLGFDHHDQERSRTVLLATDNEVEGPQIYTLEQAVKFASDQNVNVIALYPSPHGVLTAEGEQLRDVTQAAGGSFYQMDDPGAVNQIMGDIAAEQLVETEGDLVETDRPKVWVLWLAFALLGLLGVRSVFSSLP